MTRALAVSSLVVFFVVTVALIALLSFAVTVDGDSMDPTLRTGDRLSTNLLGRKHVERFDLVEALEPGSSTRIVKRVIGLPGDTLWIADVAGVPTVHLKPKGSDTTYFVRNPSWPAQIGSSLGPCCSASGTSSSTAQPVLVPDGHYWLIGDNWGGSTDSRSFGFVGSTGIVATVNFRILPWSRFGAVPAEGLVLQAASDQH